MDVNLSSLSMKRKKKLNMLQDKRKQFHFPQFSGKKGLFNEWHEINFNVAFFKVHVIFTTTKMSIYIHYNFPHFFASAASLANKCGWHPFMNGDFCGL